MFFRLFIFLPLSFSFFSLNLVTKTPNRVVGRKFEFLDSEAVRVGLESGLERCFFRGSRKRRESELLLSSFFFSVVSFFAPPPLTRPASCRIEPIKEMNTQKTARPKGTGPPREARLRRCTPSADDADLSAERREGGFYLF